MGPILNLTLNELIAAATLLQAILFLLFILFSQYRQNLQNNILALLFFIIFTAKLDQIYQMQGGILKYPEFAFVLVPLQLLIAPCLYFFVKSKVTPDFNFKPKHLVHLIPTIMLYCYYGFLTFGHDANDIRALIQSGILTGSIDTLVIPLISDIIQLCYLAAALLTLQQLGLVFKNWFSGNEDKIINGLQIIFIIWALIFITHLFITLFSAITEIGLLRVITFEMMNILHLVMVNALMFVGIVSHLKWPTTSMELSEKPRYATSSLSEGERTQLFEKTQKMMNEHKYYENPSLTLDQLAYHLAATARELSEAINGIGNQSFYSYVNGYRLNAAAEQILSKPDENILQIALNVGFNSKSSFNTLFKRHFNLTPRQYRQQSQ